MSRLLYSATMSLDGFIAGVDGDMSWLTDLLVRSSPEVDELMNSVGAILVGNRTFSGDDPNKGTDEEGAFSGQWHGPVVVLTHAPPPEGGDGGGGDGGDDDDVVFAHDLRDAIAAARAAAGDRYVNVLGANVARQCLEIGELDEVLVLIAPILLGDGVRLFDHPGGTQVRLDPVDPDRTGPLSLWYRVRR